MSAPVADDEVGTMSAVSSEASDAVRPSKHGRGRGGGKKRPKDRAAPPPPAEREGEEDAGGESDSGGDDGDSSDDDTGSSDEGDVSTDSSTSAAVKRPERKKGDTLSILFSVMDVSAGRLGGVFFFFNTVRVLFVCVFLCVCVWCCVVLCVWVQKAALLLVVGLSKEHLLLFFSFFFLCVLVSPCSPAAFCSKVLFFCLFVCVVFIFGVWLVLSVCCLLSFFGLFCCFALVFFSSARCLCCWLCVWSACGQRQGKRVVLGIE